MAKKKKTKLPFDRRSGVIVICRYLLESGRYINLSPQAKTLMILLQTHWLNDKPVDYGIREAQKKIPCCNKTAIKAFKELEKNGFVHCLEQSSFNSRTQSKSRSWQLLWLPYKGKPPENDWDVDSAKRNIIVKRASEHRSNLSSNNQQL
jgi:hypothetical protein